MITKVVITDAKHGEHVLFLEDFKIRATATGPDVLTATITGRITPQHPDKQQNAGSLPSNQVVSQEGRLITTYGSGERWEPRGR